ncbi:MAG TPA: hypothetical protein VHZ54_04585 [Solirubrobacterales bacterium]|jgi:hypothetical protein|nr:hypothetical protein [Solirubrobacterales bacterium]
MTEIHCVLVADDEQFETNGGFSRVPCVGEILQPQEDSGGWPDDALGISWRVIGVRWVLTGSGSRAMVSIERMPDDRSGLVAADHRSFAELSAELEEKYGIRITLGPEVNQ